MAIIQFSHVNFQYPTRISPTLSDVTLDIEHGDFLLVSGPTGCGKTTLLKMLNGMIPHLSKGRFEGSLTIAGRTAASSSMEELTQKVGIIFQCPDDQIVSNTVEEEIAFGLENMGMAQDAISLQIDASLDRIGIAGLRYRETRALSGGQKQRVVIASQMAMRPEILAFDEPLSQLDPRGAREVMQCIVDLNRQGITVVMVEHRISDVARFANKVLLLDGGRVAYFGDMQQSFCRAGVLYEKLGVHIPEEVVLSRGLDLPEISFSSKTLKKEIEDLVRGSEEQSIAETPMPLKQKRHITLQNIQFGYRKNFSIFSDLNLEFYAGESVALMGANGSGKSTLLSIIAGIRKPQHGQVLFYKAENNKDSQTSAENGTGILIQNPDLMLFCESVEREMLFGPEHQGVKPQESLARINSIMGQLDLTDHGKDAPFSLSVGQRLRTALGSVLAMETPTLLLDEPTTGQNQENITRIMETIQNLSFLQSIIFCTHDIQTAMRYADRIILLRDGTVAYDGSPLHVFDDMELAEACGMTIPISILLAKTCGMQKFQGRAKELLSLLGKGVCS